MPFLQNSCWITDSLGSTRSQSFGRYSIPRLKVNDSLSFSFFLYFFFSLTFATSHGTTDDIVETPVLQSDNTSTIDLINIIVSPMLQQSSYIGTVAAPKKYPAKPPLDFMMKLFYILVNNNTYATKKRSRRCVWWILLLYNQLPSPIDKVPRTSPSPIHMLPTNWWMFMNPSSQSSVANDVTQIWSTRVHYVSNVGLKWPTVWRTCCSYHHIPRCCPNETLSKSRNKFTTF